MVCPVRVELAGRRAERLLQVLLGCNVFIFLSFSCLFIAGTICTYIRDERFRREQGELSETNYASGLVHNLFIDFCSMSRIPKNCLSPSFAQPSLNQSTPSLSHTLLASHGLEQRPTLLSLFLPLPPFTLPLPFTPSLLLFQPYHPTVLSLPLPVL